MRPTNLLDSYSPLSHREPLAMAVNMQQCSCGPCSHKRGRTPGLHVVVFACSWTQIPSQLRATIIAVLVSACASQESLTSGPDDVFCPVCERDSVPATIATENGVVEIAVNGARLRLDQVPQASPIDSRGNTICRVRHRSGAEPCHHSTAIHGGGALITLADVLVRVVIGSLLLASLVCAHCAVFL